MAYDYNYDACDHVSPYPFNLATWTVQDQKYWCNMVLKYRYPIERVPEKYRCIIENGRCNTFEAEYEEWIAENPWPDYVSTESDK